MRSGAAPEGPPLLSVENVDTFYGSVQAHFDVSLRIGPGELVCLLGGNASGKSTMMKVILGLVKPAAGKIFYDGQDITTLRPNRRVAAGIASVPEARRVFADMTVEENILMGAFVRNDRKEILRDRDRMLGLFPRLRERLDEKAGVLSGGEQQFLAMARALMSRPRLVCMDEPTMGLSPLYVDKVLRLIADVNATGVAVLLVEQNAHQALSIADRAYVLRNGVMHLSGDAAALLGDVRVREAYLGGSADPWGQAESIGGSIDTNAEVEPNIAQGGIR